MDQFEVDVVEALVEGGPEKVFIGGTSHLDPVIAGWAEVDLDESGTLTFQYDKFAVSGEDVPVEATIVRFVEVEKLLDALAKTDFVMADGDREAARTILQEALDAPAL